MFGYVIANSAALNDDQRERYRAWYCGLCRALGKRHGFSARMTLTYDMTFFTILLSSVYEKAPIIDGERCAIHPIKKHTYFSNETTDYAADMNILLSWYSLRDNWDDDRSIPSLLESKLFERTCRRIEKDYPRQAESVRTCISALAQQERAGQLNPDIPANCFGQLMGELFVIDQNDRLAQQLRSFGRALGRFIYIMDACVDFDKDIRRLRYNPMVGVTKTCFESVLTMLTAECAESFDKLPVQTDRDILENILYSGVWVKYNAKYGRKENTGDNE